jgi:hypothetical protein
MKLQSQGFLTTEERSKLDALEKIITKGKRSFVEVGLALAEIKEAKLYRQTHKTFAEYCESKWGWKRDYAYKIIGGAEAVKGLPENVCHGIQTERQARALASVPEAKRVEVLEKAHARAEEEDRPVTARDISEASRTTIANIPITKTSMHKALCIAKAITALPDDSTLEDALDYIGAALNKKRGV